MRLLATLRQIGREVFPDQRSCNPVSLYAHPNPAAPSGRLADVGASSLQRDTRRNWKRAVDCDPQAILEFLDRRLMLSPMDLSAISNRRQT
jgi:hypothetical protein